MKCCNVVCDKVSLLNYDYGYELWKYMINTNLTEMCKVLKKLGLTKINRKIYINSIYGKYKNIYKEKYTSFPHPSYLRLAPKYYNKEEILFGTYDFQNYLYNSQHPSNCNNRKFLLIKGWTYYAGHMSEIHFISSYLQVALESNRIAIFDPRYKSIVANGEYCNNFSQNWECYLEPLTNCTLNINDIKTAVKFINYNQTERFVVLDISPRYLYIYPSMIIQFFKPYNFSKQFYLMYWIIQSVTYVFRLNNRTHIYLTKNVPLIKEMREEKYMNVWVRHGNKVHEMKLIPTSLYEYSIKFYFKLWGESDLYISSDDPQAIEYFSKKYKIKYLDYRRKDDPSPFNALNSGANLTLNVISDLFIAISSSAYSGTLESNIARIINELRMTVGYRLNSPYFEIGNLNKSYTFIDFI